MGGLGVSAAPATRVNWRKWMDGSKHFINTIKRCYIVLLITVEERVTVKPVLVWQGCLGRWFQHTAETYHVSDILAAVASKNGWKCSVSCAVHFGVLGPSHSCFTPWLRTNHMMIIGLVTFRTISKVTNQVWVKWESPSFVRIEEAPWCELKCLHKPKRRPSDYWKQNGLFPLYCCDS